VCFITRRGLNGGAGGIMRILTLGYCSNILKKIATRLLWNDTLLEILVETQKKKVS